MSSPRRCPYLRRRNAFGHFIIRKSTVKDTCLTLVWVRLRSTVNSCVLGMYRSVEWCVQTLSLLGQAVLLL